jgi:integrase-like protein
MLEDYYVKPSTIDRIRSSWLAPQIESYLEWLQAHGYSRLVVYRRLPLLFHFAEFAQKKGCRDVASCKVYVPLGPNLAVRLKRYVEQRHGSNAAPERPLFSFTKRGCIHEATISQTFHTLLPKLQLHIPPGVSPPRLHDLRHSFAVATLLRWYRQGIDPNCRLIHLSTFLGHADPNSTAVYLTITDELPHQAAQRFQVLAPKGGVR